MSRLSIEISPKQHQHIKALAAIEGQSIKEFVISKLFKGEKNGDPSLEELKQFLTTRIEEAKKGEISNRSVAEITEDILGDPV